MSPRCWPRQGYRVIVPYLRGYGTTRFLSDETLRNGQQSAARSRCDRADGRARDRPGGPRRVRLGSAHGRHRRGALARALQGARLGQRLPDRQPGSRQAAAAARGRAPVVVPVLLRHRARPRRLRQVPARVREAHLANRLAEVGLRRRHVRSQRGGLRQPGSRRDRDPQLPLAARAGRRRAPSTTSSRDGSPKPRSSPCPRSRWRATPTARPTRSRVPTPSKFSGTYSHRTIEGGIGHDLPQEAPEAFAQAVIDVDRH